MAKKRQRSKQARQRTKREATLRKEAASPKFAAPTNAALETEDDSSRGNRASQLIMIAIVIISLEQVTGSATISFEGALISIFLLSVMLGAHRALRLLKGNDGVKIVESRTYVSLEQSAWDWVGHIGFLITLLFCFYCLWGKPDFSRVPKIVTTMTAYSTLWGGLTQALILPRLVISYSFIANARFRRAVKIVDAVIDITIATSVMACIVYMSGIANFVSISLRAWWPSVSNSVLDQVAKLVNILISGILGNAAYDLLKRIFRKIRSRISREVSPPPNTGPQAKA